LGFKNMYFSILTYLKDTKFNRIIGRRKKKSESFPKKIVL